MNEPDIYGVDIFGDPILRTIAKGPLGREFMVPPFSVLNARDGQWQTRKKAWIALGIQSELGRRGSAETTATNDLRGGLTFRISNNAYAGKKASKKSRTGGLLDIDAKEKPKQLTAGTSIFDPVLCELVYRWFCPTGGQIIDPFAGGSVRGIVAASLGRMYWGCDLSKRQIESNYQQAEMILDFLGDSTTQPDWRVGDAFKLVRKAPRADLIFTCPPYGNLEVYSKHPRDLSNMEDFEFDANYSLIIEDAARRLKNNRFAAIVVANYRGSDGCYVDLVGKTIRAFASAGMKLYNECILVTSVGSLAVRTRVQFVGSRKLGKGHQQLLIFLKGDPKKATKAIMGERQ